MHIVKTFLYVLFILLIGWFVYQNRHDFSVVANLTIGWAIALYLLNVIATISQGQIFHTTLMGLGLRLPLWEWLSLSVYNTLYSLVFPLRAGMAVRAGYLKTKYQFNLSLYASFMASTVFIQLLASGLSALVVGLFLYFTDQLHIRYLAIALGLFLFSAFALWVIGQAHRLKPSETNRVINFVVSTAKGLKELTKADVLVKLLISYLIQNVLLALRLHLSYGALGLKSGFIKVLFVQSLVSFSNVVSITPGNLGIREVLIGAGKEILGLTFHESFAGALLDRVVGITTILILSLLFYLGSFFVQKGNKFHT